MKWSVEFAQNNVPDSQLNLYEIASAQLNTYNLVKFKYISRYISF